MSAPLPDPLPAPLPAPRLGVVGLPDGEKGCCVPVALLPRPLPGPRLEGCNVESEVMCLLYMAPKSATRSSACRAARWREGLLCPRCYVWLQYVAAAVEAVVVVLPSVSSAARYLQPALLQCCVLDCIVDVLTGAGH